MKLMFIGAAREVTGSCHYLEAAGFKILVDCGMEQGIDKFDRSRRDASFYLCKRLPGTGDIYCGNRRPLRHYAERQRPYTGIGSGMEEQKGPAGGTPGRRTIVWG